MKIIALIVPLALVGCSSSGALTAEQKQLLISEYAQQKTLEISCDTGCTVAYKDPRDQLKLPEQTNGWDVLNTTVKTLGGVATSAMPYAAIGVIAAEGFKSSGDNIDGSYNTSTNSTTPTDNSVSLNGSYNTDSTHAPTVVNQPAPVVVQQPDPVVVQPYE